MIQTSLRIGAIILSSLATLFLALLLYLGASTWIWYPRQRSRVRDLEARPVETANENQFSVRPLDDSLPYSSLRMIATHNSYHLEPDWIRRFLIGLAEPEEPERLRYSHQPLWDQLENGIRSFELDVRARGNRFTITHVPLVDSRGPHPDFSLALREIVLWSERRPGHVPVVVLLELKRDWMFLDPGLIEWDAATLDRLDTAVESAVPRERLFRPSDLARGADSLVSEVTAHGWPSLGEMRDRILLVIHTDPQIDSIYSTGDPTFADRPMFTSRPGSEEALGESPEPAGQRSDAVFVIHNEPDPAAIGELTDRGMIVRTRADGDGSATPEQRAAALSSTAQIVSTDLPPGHPNDPALGQVEFGPGRTLKQR